MGSLTKRMVMWVKLIAEITFVLVYLIFELLKELYYVIAGRQLKDVSGKTVLITGAAQGLGREMALDLASKGCRIICVDILKEGNEETAQKIRKLGQKSDAYTCDVTNREKVMELASDVGQVDILINNAGVIYFDPILDTSPHIVKKLIDVNVTSQFWMIQAFLPGMLERKQGHIVAIASCAGLQGLPDAILYSTSKYAVVGLMRTLELELRLRSQQYIKTTCICPYFINTVKDVEFRIQSRLPHLETKEASCKIISAVLKELPEVTIPGSFSTMFFFNSILPRQIQYMMRDVFHANVLPKEMMNNLTEEKKLD